MRVTVWYSAAGNIRTKKITGVRLQAQVFEDSPPSVRGGRAGHVWELDKSGAVVVAHLYADVVYMRQDFRDKT